MAGKFGGDLKGYGFLLLLAIVCESVLRLLLLPSCSCLYSFCCLVHSAATLSESCNNTSDSCKRCKPGPFRFLAPSHEVWGIADALAGRRVVVSLLAQLRLEVCLLAVCALAVGLDLSLLAVCLGACLLNVCVLAACLDVSLLLRFLDEVLEIGAQAMQPSAPPPVSPSASLALTVPQEQRRRQQR